MLYTYIFEFRGGTFCKQVSASSVDEGLLLWGQSLGISEGFDDEMKLDVLEKIKESRLGAFIDNTVNVWCETFLIEDDLGLLHIVQTDGKTTTPDRSVIGDDTLPPNGNQL